ncbi:unnamed protein product [Cuscuta epithymum]|uniref:Uncharacterized protein n=1 Tax=Cuscuta epithymum TaxID=186058 RepID=A0AAV0CMS6_9ASTE|nr:unnamed protein product [Cuscuta epithymum]CAH9141518.1 unnamed protein product [Cuscuta epithymum]
MQFLSFPTALSSHNSICYPPFLRSGARLSNQIIGITPISPFTAQLSRTLSLIDQSSYPSSCYNAVHETVNTGDATEMEFVETGYVCSVHGLQGEVRVKPATDFPEMRFSEPGRRWLRQQILGRQIIQEFELVEGRGHHGQKSWIIKFYGINTVEQAQKLVGSTILVAENDRPTLQEGEVYTRDLVGMRVLLKETRELVGTVINVFNTGANDLLQVELDSSFRLHGQSMKLKRQAGASGTLVWVPFVEAIVPDVDLRKKEMLITPPMGLLELNIRSDDRPKKERRQLEWKERKKFQRQLIQAKKKLQEMEQHHVFQGFRYGVKSQKSRLANEIVSVNSKLIGYALNNMVVPSRRWSFSDFVRTSTKHTLKVSEEICYNGKGENSERGQHLISCGKAAFVLYATQMDLENTMEETYQHLKKALLHDDAGDRSSVPLILICPTHSLDSMKELFMNHDFFSFDSEKVWFLAEEMLPVVSSSQEENKHNILMKSPWEILQRPVGSGGIVATLSIHNLLENLREMNVDYIQICSINNRCKNQQMLLGFTDLCEANIGIQFKDMNSNEDDLNMVLSIGFMEKLTKQIDKLHFHAILKPNQHSKLVEQEWVDVTPSSPNSYEFHCSLLSCVNACSPTKVCLIEVAA